MAVTERTGVDRSGTEGRGMDRTAADWPQRIGSEWNGWDWTGQDEMERIEKDWTGLERSGLDRSGLERKEKKRTQWSAVEWNGRTGLEQNRRKEKYLNAITTKREWDGQ